LNDHDFYHDLQTTTFRRPSPAENNFIFLACIRGRGGGYTTRQSIVVIVAPWWGYLSSYKKSTIKEWRLQ